MTKTCKWCKCEFEAEHVRVRYCSPECARMALRKQHFEANQKVKEECKRLGITYKEYWASHAAKRRPAFKPGKPAPKSYAEIAAANRRHPLADGWRGQVVHGGGLVRNFRDPRFAVEAR